MNNLTTDLLIKLRYLERGLIVAITITMIGLYGFNVFVREVLPQYASSFAWIDEASRILMVWGVFMTLGLALERGRHIAMSSLLVALSPKIQFYIRKLIDLVGFTFSIYSAWLAYNLTIFVFNTGQMSPTLNLPMFILYIAPLSGFILLGFRYALDLFGFTDRRGSQNLIAQQEITAG